MADLSELANLFGFDFDLDIDLKNSLDQLQDQRIDTQANQTSSIDQDNDNLGKVAYQPVQLAYNTPVPTMMPRPMSVRITTPTSPRM